MKDYIELITECMNPYSTVNRKIPAVIYELVLGNISHAIYDKVEEYKKTAAGRKKIMPMLERYFGDRYSGMTVEEFINLHNNKPISEVYY